MRKMSEGVVEGDEGVVEGDVGEVVIAASSG